MNGEVSVGIVKINDKCRQRYVCEGCDSIVTKMKNENDKCRQE
jgi:hypothetical protein